MTGSCGAVASVVAGAVVGGSVGATVGAGDVVSGVVSVVAPVSAGADADDSVAEVTSSDDAEHAPLSPTRTNVAAALPTRRTVRGYRHWVPHHPTGGTYEVLA